MEVIARSDVVAGQYLPASEATEEDVFGAPAPDPGEVDQGGIRPLVVGVSERFEVDLAARHLAGQCRHGMSFVPAESEVPQELGIGFGQPLGGREPRHRIASVNDGSELLGQPVEEVYPDDK